jgi:hypothetical protein
MRLRRSLPPQDAVDPAAAWHLSAGLPHTRFARGPSGSSPTVTPLAEASAAPSGECRRPARRYPKWCHTRVREEPEGTFGVE